MNDCFGYKKIEKSVEDIFGCSSSKRFYCLSKEIEDRSLFSSNIGHLTESTHKDSAATIRLVEVEDENQHPDPSLSQCHKMLIAPVIDLLDEPELVIVPDRVLYTVPFAALKNEDGKYLSRPSGFVSSLP